MHLYSQSNSSSSFLKFKWIYLLLFLLPFFIVAQVNLVPNPSFEVYKSCPDGNGVGIDSVPPWRGTNKSTDYFNVCGTNGFSVPSTSAGFQQPRTGEGFAGQYFLNTYGGNVREYVQVPLTQSLQPGVCYITLFYLNLPNSGFKYACNNIGAYLSLNSFTTPSFANSVAPYIPQIIANGNPIIKDTLKWMAIGGIYKAIGGERFLTIGNFKNDSNTDTITVNPGEYSAAAYFIDDVSVQKISSPSWLRDTLIYMGDSVFIGSNFGGLTCKWYNIGNQLLDSIPGFYVKPNIDTKYIAHHSFCGNTFIDTIEVKINTNLVGMNGHTKSIQTYMYPQPVNEELIISFTEQEAGKLNISLYDIFGKLIKEEEMEIRTEKVKIDASQLENGYYLIQIKSNNKIVIDRFFVCH